MKKHERLFISASILALLLGCCDLVKAQDDYKSTIEVRKTCDTLLHKLDNLDPKRLRKIYLAMPSVVAGLPSGFGGRWGDFGVGFGVMRFEECPGCKRDENGILLKNPQYDRYYRHRWNGDPINRYRYHFDNGLAAAVFSIGGNGIKLSSARVEKNGESKDNPFESKDKSERRILRNVGMDFSLNALDVSGLTRSSMSWRVHNSLYTGKRAAVSMALGWENFYAFGKVSETAWGGRFGWYSWKENEPTYSFSDVLGSYSSAYLVLTGLFKWESLGNMPVIFTAGAGNGRFNAIDRITKRGSEAKQDEIRLVAASNIHPFFGAAINILNYPKISLITEYSGGTLLFASSIALAANRPLTLTIGKPFIIVNRNDIQFNNIDFFIAMGTSFSFKNKKDENKN